MGFRTVHYLDYLLRTELWKYSVRALMSHVLYGQWPLSAAAKDTDTLLGSRGTTLQPCRVTSVGVCRPAVAHPLKNLHG